MWNRCYGGEEDTKLPAAATAGGGFPNQERLKTIIDRRYHEEPINPRMDT